MSNLPSPTPPKTFSPALSTLRTSSVDISHWPLPHPHHSFPHPSSFPSLRDPLVQTFLAGPRLRQHIANIAFLFSLSFYKMRKLQEQQEQEERELVERAAAGVPTTSTASSPTGPTSAAIAPPVRSRSGNDLVSFGTISGGDDGTKDVSKRRADYANARSMPGSRRHSGEIRDAADPAQVNGEGVRRKGREGEPMLNSFLFDDELEADLQSKLRFSPSDGGGALVRRMHGADELGLFSRHSRLFPATDSAWGGKYLQMNTDDDKFPILVRRDSYPGIVRCRHFPTLFSVLVLTSFPCDSSPRRPPLSTSRPSPKLRLTPSATSATRPAVPEPRNGPNSKLAVLPPTELSTASTFSQTATATALVSSATAPSRTAAVPSAARRRVLGTSDPARARQGVLALVLFHHPGAACRRARARPPSRAGVVPSSKRSSETSSSLGSSRATRTRTSLSSRARPVAVTSTTSPTSSPTCVRNLCSSPRQCADLFLSTVSLVQHRQRRLWPGPQPSLRWLWWPRPWRVRVRRFRRRVRVHGW